MESNSHFKFIVIVMLLKQKESAYSDWSSLAPPINNILRYGPLKQLNAYTGGNL